MNFIGALNRITTCAIEQKYHSHAIPSDIDNEISEAIKNFIKEGNVFDEGKELESDAYKLLALYAERMASLAVRESNIDRVETGIVAISIIQHSEESDIRDSLLIVSILHDAVTKLGLDPANYFGKWGRFFKDDSLLSDFLKRDKEDKSIQVMGYEESDDGGFLYKRNW